MMTPTTVVPVLVPYAGEIAALRSAIASGAMTVSYDGKSVTYDDLAGMKRRLALLLGWQSEALTGQPRRLPQAGFATFTRGTFGR